MDLIDQQNASPARILRPAGLTFPPLNNRTRKGKRTKIELTDFCDSTLLRSCSRRSGLLPVKIRRRAERGILPPPCPWFKPVIFQSGDAEKLVYNPWCT
ncbi:MAG: hypothetical protein CMJ74_02585 [Planctomycetaceae bacterium]|nr:hypothetical protein [Planctomycetaceae bacterium]